jgi:hypothetical protein
VTETAIAARFLRGTTVRDTYVAALLRPDIYASDGTVAWSALDGSNVTVLALGQSEPLDLTVDSTSASSDAPYAIAVDATSVYWTDYDDGTISKAALDGSQRTTHPAHAPRRARKNLGGARAHNLLSRRPCLPMLQNASVCWLPEREGGAADSQCRFSSS